MTEDNVNIGGLEIEGAPSGNGRWLLWSIGRVRGGILSEFSLQIHCAFLPLNDKDYYHFPGIVYGWIDVGVLPLVSRGTVFQGRKIVGMWSQLEVMYFDCDTFSQTLCKPEKGGGFRQISKDETVNYPAAYSHVRNEPYYTRNEAGDIQFPCTEIIRFYLCQSASMAHSMLFSPETNTVLEPIVNINLSKWVDDTTYRIAPERSHVSAGHAQALAIVMASDDLLKLWTGCTRNYIADRAAVHPSDAYWSTIMRCELPRESRGVTVMGRRRNRVEIIKQDGQISPQKTAPYDFDVFKIVEDHRYLPFKNLEILTWQTRKNIEHEGEDNEDNEPPTRNSFSVIGGGSRRRKNKVTTGGTASSETRGKVMDFEALESKFPYLKDVEVSRIVKRDRTHITKTTTDVIEVDALATGDSATWGDDQRLHIDPIGRRPRNIERTDTPKKRPMPTRELFKEFPANKVSIVAMEGDKLPAPLTKALNMSWIVPNAQLESIGFNEVSAGKVHLLEMDMEWGPPSYLGRKRASRKAMVSCLRTKFGYASIFELEAKNSKLTFLCVLAKRDSTAFTLKEVASVLKAWSTRTVSGDIGKFVWPSHYEFKDVIGFQLKHTKVRKSDPKVMARVVGAAIDEIEKIILA